MNNPEPNHATTSYSSARRDRGRRSDHRQPRRHGRHHGPVPESVEQRRANGSDPGGAGRHASRVATGGRFGAAGQSGDLRAAGPASAAATAGTDSRLRRKPPSRRQLPAPTAAAVRPAATGTALNRRAAIRAATATAAGLLRELRHGRSDLGSASGRPWHRHRRGRRRGGRRSGRQPVRRRRGPRRDDGARRSRRRFRR